MKKTLALTALMACSLAALAQPAKPSYMYYEGVNLSMGVAQNATEATSASSNLTSNTTVAVAKVNYTFALGYPAKLGLSATFDMKNSKIGDSEYLAINSPTEVTIEPGLLLITNSLLYGKLGTYSSRYESGASASRNLTGSSVGVGIKHYVHGQNFIQAEWTLRKADDNGAGLSGVKFKQTVASVLLGFNF